MENKKRLIYANELLELYNMGEELEEYADVLSVPIPVIRKNINDMPTVDAVEVVHSSWVFNKDGSGTCKNCRRTTKNCWDYDSHMRYCPNCGAKMDT